MAKRLISAKIPEELYYKIQESEYKTNTDCIIAALNVLFSNTHQEQEKTTDSNTDLIQVLREQITIKDQQFHDLQLSHQALLASHQGLLTKVESKPLMIMEPGQNSKRWWEFWK